MRVCEVEGRKEGHSVIKTGRTFFELGDLVFTVSPRQYLSASGATRNAWSFRRMDRNERTYVSSFRGLVSSSLFAPLVQASKMMHVCMRWGAVRGILTGSWGRPFCLYVCCWFWYRGEGSMESLEQAGRRGLGRLQQCQSQ